MSWITNFIYTTTHKRKRLLGFSVAQLAIVLSVIAIGSMGVIGASQRHEEQTAAPTTKVSSADTTSSDTTPVEQPATQTTTPSPSQSPTPSTPAAKPASPSSNATIDAATRQYEESHRKFEADMAKYDQCNNTNSAAGRKYSAAIDQARIAYDQVMAQWEMVKNQPVHNPYSEFAAQAKINFNAISVPAYAEYAGTVNALKSQGCQITQTYPDYSWK